MSTKSTATPMATGSGTGIIRTAGGALRHAAALIAIWQERAATRRGLARMDDRLLRDIGLTRLDVRNELGKPFWRE